MSEAGLALVVPAHHPPPALADLIHEMLAVDPTLFVAAFVVDDGNEEEWQVIFEAVRRVPKAVVVRRQLNGGKGAALKTGVRAALELPHLIGIVTADADGQHAAADVARIGRALAETPDHLVLGARTFGPDVPFRSRTGNEITRSVFRWITGAKLLDTQTGLRGWPRAAAIRNLTLEGDGFEYELSTLLAALDMPRKEVPIETIYRDANRISHFRPVRDSIRVYGVLLGHFCYGLLRSLFGWPSTRGNHHEPSDLDRSHDPPASS